MSQPRHLYVCPDCGSLSAERYCPKHKRNRATQKRGQSQGLATAEWREKTARILQRDKYTCQIQLPGCTTTAEHVDHVIDRADGGSDDDSNLRASCAHCNLTKGGRRSPKKTPARTMAARSTASLPGKHGYEFPANPTHSRPLPLHLG